jgi:hypothetical protein
MLMRSIIKITFVCLVLPLVYTTGYSQDADQKKISKQTTKDQSKIRDLTTRTQSQPD